MNNLPHWQQLQKDIIANFDFKSLYYHYLSLAKGNIHLMKKEKKFTYKTVFYTIRGLLSADLSAQKIIPELLIDKLFQQFNAAHEVLQIAKESLYRKKQSAEKETVDLPTRETILVAIKKYATQLEGNLPKIDHHQKKLNDILTAYSFAIKQKYYS